MRAEDPTSGANVDDNGTFIARPSAKTEGTGTGTGGTFCQRRTTSESGTGGTFCARRSAASAAGDGGTLRYSHGAAATPEHGHTLEEHRAEGTLGGGTFELPPGENLSGAQPPRTVLEAWGGDTLGEPSLYATALEAAPPLGRSQSDDAIYATRSLSVKRKRLFSSSSAGTLGGTLHRDSSPPLSRAQAASDDLVDCSRRTWHVEAREARGRTLTPAEDVQLDAASRCTIS